MGERDNFTVRVRHYANGTRLSMTDQEMRDDEGHPVPFEDSHDLEELEGVPFREFDIDVLNAERPPARPSLSVEAPPLPAASPPTVSAA